MITNKIRTCACVAFLWMLCVSTTAIAGETSIKTDKGVYGKTVERWTSSFKKSHYDGTTYIKRITSNGGSDRLHKNGARDSIIFIPDVVRPDRVITVLIWFHGLGGFTERTFSRRLIPQFNELLDEGSNLIVVIPEMPWSKNTSTPRGRQGQVWRGRNNENFVDFYREVSRTVAGHFNNEHEFPDYFRVVIVGHSAGGSAIASAARSGALSKIGELQLVVFSDASYGRWFDVTWKHFGRDNKFVDIVVLVRKYDKPYQSIKRFQRHHRKLPEYLRFVVLPRKKYSHTRIGDRALLLTPVFDPMDAEPGC